MAHNPLGMPDGIWNDLTPEEQAKIIELKEARDQKAQTPQATSTTKSTSTPKPAATTPAATPDETLEILSGRDVQWFKIGGLYYAAYKLPNSTRRAVFEATPAQMDAIFGVGNRPGAAILDNLQALTSQEGMHFSGNIAELAGEGSFENAVERGIALALDGGAVPDWARDDPGIWDIIYIAQAENKSEAWTLEQIRKTKSFQQRYIGIEHLEKIGLDLPSAVEAYRQYESQLKQIMKRRPGSPEVTPDHVGVLLAKGHSVKDVEFVFETFSRLDQNQASLTAFNAILVESGRDPLGPADQFRFMAGRAPVELYEVWEQSSILSAAREAGLGDTVSARQAIALAKRTPGLTSEGAALEGMQKAAQMLLQFRQEVNVGKWGINQEDLIDLSLGLSPRSGQSMAELSQGMTRAVKDAEAFLKPRAKPFFRFSEEGRPRAASLGALRQTAL